MKLELSLKAVDLKNVAGVMKGTSDPFAVVTHMSTAAGEKPKVLGKTEVLKNTLDPSWTHVFEFDFEMGSAMKLVVTIFDQIDKRDNKPMGSAVFDVGELLGARGQTKAKKLRHGKITAHIRESAGDKGTFSLQLHAHDLKNTEGFGLINKSDPFFEIERQINSAGGDTWDNVYRSEFIKNNLSPEWDATPDLSLGLLCGGDLDLPLRITIFDHEGSGDHEFMGRFETSVNQLVAAKGSGSTFTVDKKGKAAGSATVSRAVVSMGGGGNAGVTEKMASMELSTSEDGPPKPSFGNYLAGGLELNVVVGIDFTGSNGNPRQPGTLHYIDDNSLNDYEKAISSILTILSKYDHDQKYPVLGFGAKYDGVVNQCFQCGPEPEAQGIDGVMEAYHQVFKSGLIMSSPTDITHVIAKAAERAKGQAANGDQQAYTVLLIITDGAVADVGATAACLRSVSDAPLSIVIVGVGDSDFSAMRFLDDLSSDRDIAQFVEFNKHKASRVDLSSATLQEIPQQVVSYFKSQGVSPRSPIQVEEEEIVVEEEEEEIDLSLGFEEGEIVVEAGGVQNVAW